MNSNIGRVCGPILQKKWSNGWDTVCCVEGTHAACTWAPESSLDDVHETVVLSIGTMVVLQVDGTAATASSVK